MLSNALKESRLYQGIDMVKQDKTRQDGDCFEVHAKFMLEPANQRYNWKLCHGVVRPVRGRMVGWQFVHAWLEIDDQVLDISNGGRIGCQQIIYYIFGDIQEENVVRYDLQQMRSWLVDRGTWGPWDEGLANHRDRQVQANEKYDSIR